MIIKASQRGGGTQLGLHLLKQENEHVEVHEVSGFVSESLMGAMKEAQAMAMGTRCKQHLFSVSLNPPETEIVRNDVFESAIAKIEERMGLEGQPRIVVFHEKEGRRHAHAVWSRIDAETMTAKQLSHFKSKLREVAKELYLENGWKMPKGFLNSMERDPRNFTLEEWQKAKRAGLDAKSLKGMVQECWAVSDNRESFAKALEERGLYLAKGDKRGHVAVTYEGEVFAISRLTGQKSKDVAAKLGNADALLSVAETKARIANEIAPRLDSHIQQARQNARKAMATLNEQRLAMQAKHTDERKRLDEGQKERWLAETQARSNRVRKGVMGLWDRVTGEHRNVQRRNEAEAFFGLQRDKEQKHALITAQMAERQHLQQQIRQTRTRHAQQILALHQQAANFRLMSDRQAPRQTEQRRSRDEFNRQSGAQDKRQSAEASRTRERSQRERAPRPPRAPDLGR